MKIKQRQRSGMNNSLIMKCLFLTILFLSPMISSAQVNEIIDRGIIALTVKEQQVYVSWRLLKDDPEQAAFNIYRKDIGIGDYEKVNQNPITSSTNFLDTTAAPGHGYYYKIKVIINHVEKETLGEAYVSMKKL